MRIIDGAAAIVGIGETDYLRGTNKSERRLILEASVAACRDAGIEPASVDGVIVAWYDSTNPEPAAEDFINALGITDLRYHSHLHMGGAASVAATVQAAAVIQAGLASRVLVVTGWTAYSDRFRTPPTNNEHLAVIGREIRTNLDAPNGFTSPTQWYSMHANRWFHEYGADPVGMEVVALNCRANAQLNAKAYMRGRPMTAADYRSSPELVKPFRLLDICLETDGAAAVIVASGADAHSLGKHSPVYVLGGAEGHADHPEDMATRPDILSMGITKAARGLFAELKLRHDEVDFAELYDCYTFIVLRQLEELGFCARGEASDFVADGRISLTGDLPVNTHGGLLSQAHVVGMNHLVEAVLQLRGEAGAAQLDSPSLGLVTGYGGQGDGSVILLNT